MSKDHSERRTYRKSPGRQYGYEYDPLRHRNEKSQSGKIDSGGLREPGTTRGETMSKSGSLAAQRPDLRRTRQLLRQNIIATKARFVEEGGEQEDFPEIEQPLQRVPEYPEYDEEEDTTLYRNVILHGAVVWCSHVLLQCGNVCGSASRDLGRCWRCRS